MFSKKKYPTVDLNHGLLQVSEYPVQIKEDYMQFTDSKDLNFKLYYKKYCRTLITTVNAAKRKYYDEIIEKSTNKNKSVWNIIKN